MKCRLFLCFVLAAVGSPNLFGQSLPPTAPADGFDLLKRVAQHYADAKSYHIEAVEERDSSGEFQRSWQKSVITAAEAPGNRFHYEGHAFEGEALRIGNGKTVWTYHGRLHRYTQKALSEQDSESKMPALSEYTLSRAENLRKELSDLAIHLKSASRLEDATVSINGREISCYVVRIQATDMKRKRPDYSLDKNLWIDKANETIVRITELEHTHYLMEAGVRIPVEEDTTTTFSVVELDRVMPNDFFTFIPPSDAKLTEKFPDPRHFGPDLSGEQVPSLKLKSADGKLVSLDSFRGKPVLLDIWATWCSPCVKGLEEIARIYSETQSKGLVLLSVDRDDDAKTATDFLAKKNFTWPNFHDDGQIAEDLEVSGVPRTLLIDERGKVVYDAGGASEDELRAAIAKLGQEFASVGVKQDPCAVSH